MIKKADIILTALLVLAGLAISYSLSLGVSAGDELLITVDGEKYGSYSLYEDREIVIEEGDYVNKVNIENGNVSMSFSNCTGQDCVDHNDIYETGQYIICLPHKVVLEITGGDSEYDTVAE